jgi:hypothetical protein
LLFLLFGQVSFVMHASPIVPFVYSLVSCISHWCLTSRYQLLLQLRMAQQWLWWVITEWDAMPRTSTEVHAVAFQNIIVFTYAVFT